MLLFIHLHYVRIIHTKGVKKLKNPGNTDADVATACLQWSADFTAATIIVVHHMMSLSTRL